MLPFACMSVNLSLWMEEMKESLLTSFPSSFLAYSLCIRAEKDAGTWENETVTAENVKTIPKK